jgi:hypothetical protein
MDQMASHRLLCGPDGTRALIVRSRSSRVVDFEPHFSACAEALRTIQPGAVVEVESSA